MGPVEPSRAVRPAGRHDSDPLAALMAPRRPRLVRLLEYEPSIAGGLTGRALRNARSQVVVPYVDVAAGAWIPERRRPRPLAVLVLDGKLLVAAGSDASADVALVGPGDLVDTRWLDRGAQLHVIDQARLALIDARFQLAARRWPQLVPGLTEAIFDSALEQRRLMAAVKLPRVEDRLLAFMALVMSRWGIVRPDGLLLSLPITHLTLGRLVAARRPTVTVALAALDRDGMLRRLRPGRWWMPREAVVQYAPELEEPDTGVPEAVAALAGTG